MQFDGSVDSVQVVHVPLGTVPFPQPPPPSPAVVVSVPLLNIRQGEPGPSNEEGQVMPVESFERCERNPDAEVLVPPSPGSKGDASDDDEGKAMRHQSRNRHCLCQCRFLNPDADSSTPVSLGSKNDDCDDERADEDEDDLVGDLWSEDGGSFKPEDTEEEKDDGGGEDEEEEED